MTTFRLELASLSLELCLFDLLFFYLFEEPLGLLLFPLFFGLLVLDEDQFFLEVLFVDLFEGPRDLLFLFLTDDCRYRTSPFLRRLELPLLPADLLGASSSRLLLGRRHFSWAQHPPQPMLLFHSSRAR